MPRAEASRAGVTQPSAQPALGGREDGHEQASSANSQHGKITRRDFLDGVAIGAAGLAAAAAMPHLTGAEAALAAVSANPPAPAGLLPADSTGLTGAPD